MKLYRGYIFMLLGLEIILTALNTGCANNANNKEELYCREAIGFDSDKSTASANKEVLFQNDTQTISYHVMYLPHTTAEDASAKFENDTENVAIEKTTWERNMWEYYHFCYDNNYDLLLGNFDVCFDSPDWDIELWKFVEEDEQTTSTTETLFCDRADGCYSIALTYPTENINAKNTLYYLAVTQEFQEDNDRIEKIRDRIDWNWETNKKGELVITATNNGDETAERVSCSINITTLPETEEGGNSGRYISLDSKELPPGETVTFTIEANRMKDVTDYTVDTYVHYALHSIDSEEKVWLVI